MPSLSSSYNISGLVPTCWLLFQCYVLKPAKLPKSWYIWTCPGVFLRDEQWKWTKAYMITCIYIMSRIVHSYFLRFWRYSDKQTNKLLFLLLPYEVYFCDIPDFGSRVALATWQTDRLVEQDQQTCVERGLCCHLGVLLSILDTANRCQSDDGRTSWLMPSHFIIILFYFFFWRGGGGV